MLRRAFLAALAVIATVSLGFALNITGTNSQFQNQIVKVGLLSAGVDSSIVATPSGSITTSYLLTASINRVITVASAADGVRLPACKAGLRVTVINAAAANAMNVFPNVSTETINALTAGTALSVVVNKSINFDCAIDGKWYSNLTA